MSAITSAIARVQDIAQACTTVVFKSAPDYPIESADPFPMSIAFVSSVSAYAANSSTTILFPIITLELHFSRINLKDTYTKLNEIAIEFPRRIAGDPTLNGTVDTVICTDDDRLEGTIAPFDWGNIKSQCLKFDIKFKTMQTPL
jgi:hypothetical protein